MNNFTLLCKRMVLIPTIQRNVLNNSILFNNVIKQAVAPFSLKFNLFAPDKADLPKRPLSAYMAFVKSNYDKISNELPKNVKKTEVLKLAGNKWKTLQLDEKKEYLKKAEENSKLYKQNLEEFYQKMKPEERKDFKNNLKKEKSERRKNLEKYRTRRARNAHKRPKKPPGAFFLFCKSLDRGEASLYDFVQGAASRWKMLPQEEKKKFSDEAKKQLNEYQEKLAVWESKMILEGNAKLARKKVLSRVKTIAKSQTGNKQVKTKVAEKSVKKPIKKAAKTIRKRKTVKNEKLKTDSIAKGSEQKQKKPK